MHLEIDVGNTFLKWRVREAAEAISGGGCLTSKIEEYSFDNLPDAVIEHIWVGSVAGASVNDQLHKALERRFSVTPKFAQVTSHCAGVTNSYQEPVKMGVDRWLAMVAAYQQHKNAVVVVDCGSAITVDYVTQQGVHEGGYIIPGLRIMRESLLKNTAQVRFDDETATLNSVPGKSTGEAVAHGVAYLFRALAKQMADEVQSNKKAHLVITGGDGFEFAKLANAGVYQESLVMDGLQWVCGDA